MDPGKLKVVELRVELSKRGLDSKGNKPVLVERLRQALEEEQPSGNATSAIVSNKSENTSESEEETVVKLPPRTPSRSSRHTSREPTTPVRTPTRRSNSRSSLSRQSPAKTTVGDGNEVAIILEPIVEEDKLPLQEDTVIESCVDSVTPKKDVALKEPTPASALIPLIEKETEPESPKTRLFECLSSPKKEVESKQIVSPSELKEEIESKQDVSSAQIKNKSIEEYEFLKKNEFLEIVKEAEKHVDEKSQEIIRVPAEELCQVPAEESCQVPAEELCQVPAEELCQVPAEESSCQVPAEESCQVSEKTNIQSFADTDAQSPTKIIVAKSSTKTSEISDSFNKSPKIPPILQKLSSPTRENQNKKFKSDQDFIDDEKFGEIEEKKESVDNQEKSDKTLYFDEQQGKEEKSSDRKRKRSSSPIPEDAPRAPPIARPENEPNYDENNVYLSWYDSDLHLVINTINNTSASPMQGEGFNYMWAGARVSYGFNKGKVFYEARINTEFDNLAAQSAVGVTNSSGALPVDEEKIPSSLRVGWSINGTSLQLGEEKLSFGYESSGKKASNNIFEEYGKAFAKDDVIGCFADFESDDGTVTLTFMVNGESQNPAFIINKEDLADKALFPHVLSKNCSFTLNLGQEEPWSSNILEGYQFIGKVDLNERLPGPRRPAKREDCEVILLCGLPFSGKTSWALKHVTENPDKLYNVLGTHTLIDKMKVEGAPLKDKFKGRWEVVEEKCSRALAKLLESAPSRRRNYILDQQANVYGSAQRRKMRNFYGFYRKAVVLVPADEEFKQRINKCQEESSGLEIKESSILEYKANITAPSVGESFEEVIWVELNEEESKKLIETYNKEGKTAGFGNQQQLSKRSRFDNGQKDRSNRDNRDHRRSGFNDRRNSSWRGGQGSWRDNRSRGPARHGGYGTSGNWRGRGGDRRQDDRRPGNDRNRSRQGWSSTSYQQNWGSQPSSWQSQAQNWGNQGWGNQHSQAWGGSGAWKGYGQQQTSYSQQSTSQNYGNGNWNWGSQYYNQQYWGQQNTPTAQTSGQSQQSSATQSINKK